MSTSKYIAVLISFVSFLTLSGCAAPKKYDYTNYKAHMPSSVLILPPTNSTVDVKASYSTYASTTVPLAESGYYVIPLTLVDEVFKSNGMQTPNDIHQIPLPKLREVFGADAVLYMNVEQYGTKYFVIGSATVVTVSGKLVDSLTGKILWEGKASASSEENENNQGGGLAALLIGALVKQVMASALDVSHDIAVIADDRLLTANPNNGILLGPKHPNFAK